MKNKKEIDVFIVEKLYGIINTHGINSDTKLKALELLFQVSNQLGTQYDHLQSDKSEEK